MLQEQSGWISGGTGESNIKHENCAKCDLQGKARQEKPEQGLDNSPHVHKEKLWESNQIFLCIPCAAGSLCSRKNFLMEKAFENWKNFFRKTVKSLVPEVWRNSSDRSCRCSPSWELEGGVEQWEGQPDYQSKLVVFVYCSFTYLTHTGDSADFYMFLRKCAPLPDYLALFCLLLTCFGINKNNLKLHINKDNLNFKYLWNM